MKFIETLENTLLKPNAFFSKSHFLNGSRALLKKIVIYYVVFDIISCIIQKL